MNATLQAHALLPSTLGFTSVLMLAACTSTPPAPLTNMRAAQQAIATAERGETSAAKANAVNDEMRRSNGALVDEMKRNSGDQP